MFNRFKALFVSEPSDQTQSLDPSLAAAALMFEVVWADHDISTEELQAMSTLLQNLFQLSPERVTEIHEITRENHDTSVGVFPFTQALNEQLNQEDKYRVLKAMWSIAFADASIDAFEEHTIRRTADLLYLPHQKFIEAKLAARQEHEASD